MRFFRLSALGPGARISLGLLLVLAIGVALFDWNWFRRPLERYLTDRSGREVRIGDLHISLGPALAPTVRLRDVYIENAPWASGKHMAVAGEAIFVFSLRTLTHRRKIISRIVLRDADVSLERDETDRRNWRLTHPDKVGRGGFRILTLEPHRSQVRFIHRAIDFDIVTAASPVAAGAAAAGKEGARNVGPLTNRITFKGSYRGTAFAGEALTGDFLSFWDSGESFPARGHAVSGKTRLDIDGSLADMLRLSAMDAKVRIAGPSLSTLHPFITYRPAASRPFEAEGHVRYADAEYTVTQLRGKLGGTNLAGEANFAPRRESERPLVRATLQSEDANLADLAPLAGIPSPTERTAAEPGETPRGKKPAGQRSERGGGEGVDPLQGIFSGQPIRADRLKAIDAHVTLDARKLKAPEVPALESLRLTVKLDDGMLHLDPVDARMAGGRVAGSVSFNARQEPPSAAATITASGLQIEKLMPSLPANARIAGRVRARIKLSGGGKSLAAILGNSTGAAAAIVNGGSISNLADARIALNRAKIVGLLIRGDRDIAIRCGVIAFDFHNGKGKSQAILLDTEQTRVAGTGTVDLRGQQIDLLLTPEPRKRAIFSLDKSIRLLGPFADPAMSLVDRVPMEGMKAASSSIRALLQSGPDKGEQGGGCAQALAPERLSVRGQAPAAAQSRE